MTRQELEKYLDEYNKMWGTDVKLSDIEDYTSMNDDEYMEEVEYRMAMGESFDSATQYPMI